MTNTVVFHSVGNTNPSWHRNWLSCLLDHFDRFCSFLKGAKYQAIVLEDWYQLQNYPEIILDKQVVLTFDDGYLDNWVYAYPILKQYGLKGTIFINPEFVDPSEEIRPNLDDVLLGKCQQADLQTLGFLNWAEIKEMNASGMMDIQSHGMSHNFYFISDKIVDVYEGQAEYDWLAWIHKPECKPFYITEDQRHLIAYGYPIFEYGRALGLRRYFPDSRLVDFATQLYAERGTEKDNASIIKLLNEKIKQCPGRFESDEEMERRYRYELFESKRILEEKLNKKVEFLCWPGRGYNNLSIKLSIEAGYKASTITSPEKHKVLDNSGEYKRIQRFGMGSFITTRTGSYLVKTPNYFIHNFKGKTGNFFYRNLNRARKLSCIIRDYIF